MEKAEIMQSRRQFLKKSLTVAAGLAVTSKMGSLATALAEEPTATATPEPYKWIPSAPPCKLIEEITAADAPEGTRSFKFTTDGRTCSKSVTFDIVGDDYILKPFRLEELGARVAAHLRREMRKSGKTKAKFIDDLVIDYGKRTVSFQGTPLTFTKKEFDIIELLSMHRGQIFDKERIYESVWGWDSEGDSAVVAEHIRRIRAKLNAVSGKNYIETVWGVGYQWA